MKGSELKKYRRKVVNHRYFDELNERSAWVLGFWMADGSIVKRHHSYQVSFVQKDRVLVEAIKAELGSDHAISRLLRAHSLTFMSKHIGLRLHEIFGMDDLMSKSNRLQWPVLLPDTLFWHFLRGWSDGDGHIKSSYGTNRFTLTCGSEQILRTLCYKLTQKTGIECSIYLGTHGHHMTCCGINAKALIQEMYRNATIWYSARRKQAERLMDWKAPQVPRNVSEKTAMLFPTLIQSSLMHGQSDSASGYYGVRQVASGRWMAKVSDDYKGTYDTPEEAAAVHDHHAREEFGARALLNFV